MSSRVTNKAVHIVEKPRNLKPFLKSKDLACPTCKKCIYSANHDMCILKYLAKVNSHASVQKKDAQSHKTTKRYIPIEKKSDSKNHGRQIPIGQRFSPNKSSAMYVKTTHPRSGLTWKPIGRIFTYVGLSASTSLDPKPISSKGSTNNIEVILLSIHSDDGNPSSVNIKQNCGRGSNTLSWKSCQGGSSKLNLPDHRFRRRCRNLIPAESNSQPRAHTQATKTTISIKIQESRKPKFRQILSQL
ncbi:hypothetical protein Tco_0298483 [Tanacetum coccineum]